MPDAEKIGQGPESAAGNLPETVSRIFVSNPSPEGIELVRQKHQEIIDPSDQGNIKLYERFRQNMDDLELPGGWSQTVETARPELGQVPSDCLPRLLERFEQFIESLPAGHGKGHLLRDSSVNLIGMLNDPKLKAEKLDEVELFVGAMAAVFHDSGTSIIDRHIDAYSVGAHAEVGAVLFGEVAQDIIPPNLLKLIQYAIAAHTHYTKPLDVHVSEQVTYTKRKYNDLTGPGGRTAIWMTRQADRRDMSNFAQLVRDMIVHIRPVQDFDGENFYPALDPEENFATYYGLPPEGNQTISHEMMYCLNVFKHNDYTSHDSKYFTEVLMTPGVGDLLLFWSVIAPDKRSKLLADIEQANPMAAGQLKNELGHYSDQIETYSNHSVSDEDIVAAVNGFRNICRMIEPSAKLEEELAEFESRFPGLPREEQETWAKGMMFMSNVLFPRWRGRLAESVSEDLHLGSIITSQDPAAQQQFEELGRQLQEIARQTFASMDEIKAQTGLK